MILLITTPPPQEKARPQLGGGIEIAQLSYYSRGKTPPLCLPVCRRLQLVSFDDGILVVEWIQSTALWYLCFSQHTTLALNWTKREVGKARPDQSAGHAKP